MFPFGQTSQERCKELTNSFFWMEHTSPSPKTNGKKLRKPHPARDTNPEALARNFIAINFASYAASPVIGHLGRSLGMTTRYAMQGLMTRIAKLAAWSTHLRFCSKWRFLVLYNSNFGVLGFLEISTDRHWYLIWRNSWLMVSCEHFVYHHTAIPAGRANSSTNT